MSSRDRDAAWVHQEDAEGCGIAALAMICGHSYADVKATVDGWSEKGNDWAKNGCTHYTLDRYLAAHGWYMQRRYDAWAEIAKVPFAPIHYASVQQPSNRGHFVVVLADGGVLDPMREGVFALSDWQKVNQLVGLVPDPLPVVKALRRYISVSPERIPALTEDAHFGVLRALTDFNYAVDRG